MAIREKTFNVEESNFDQLSREISNHPDKNSFLDYFRCLCICHDVTQFKLQNSNDISFTGSSQDEIKFLDMCRDVGLCRFLERNSDELKLEVNGQIEQYHILKVVEFDSDRKRMSVIVQTPDKKIINFIKGADVAIIPRVSKSEDITEIIRIQDKFAS